MLRRHAERSSWFGSAERSPGQTWAHTDVCSSVVLGKPFRHGVTSIVGRASWRQRADSTSGWAPHPGEQRTAIGMEVVERWRDQPSTETAAPQVGVDPDDEEVVVRVARMVGLHRFAHRRNPGETNLTVAPRDLWGSS